jgi:uncharacterized protein
MFPFLFNLLLAVSCHAVEAPADFKVPPLSGPVVDQAGVLSSATKGDLERFLRQLVDRGGAQIQIATVSNLGGISIEEASIKITDQWKLGKKKEDRGLLLLIAQTERKVRIEVGQGLEGDLPDITASRIIGEVIVPRLKEGSADRALTDGVLAIVQYTDPKLLDDLQAPTGAQSQSVTPKGLGNWVSIVLWLLFIFLFMLPGFFGRGRRGAGAGFVTGFLLGGMGGHGWGGSSGSGGGWSGGGGGFSGGGASGSW